MSNTQKRYPTLVLNLVGLQPSEYVLKGTERSSNPQYMAAPAAMFIPNTSKVKNADGGYRKIRFIRAADTIFVDEQEKRGYKPDPLQDGILVQNNRFSVDRTGNDIYLYDYLLACEYNASNPDRPKDARTIFEILDTEAKAEKGIDTLMLQSEANGYIFQLAEKVGDGYKYDEQKIDYFCKLFDVVAEGYAVKVQHLAHVAMTKPQQFLDVIRDSRDKVRQLVLSCEKADIISFAGKDVILVGTGGVIKSLEATKKPDKVDELIAYLQSEGGAADLKTLTTALDNKRTSVLATA